MNKAIFTICFVLFVSGQVFAEYISAPSIEWLTCDSDVVLVGKINRIEALKDEKTYRYGNCTIEINEIIKGNIEDNTPRKEIFPLASLL